MSKRKKHKHKHAQQGSIVSNQPQEQESRGKQLVAASLTFSGPLPPPNLFAAYEQALQGAGDRIIKMAEDESAHRQSIEKSITDARLAQEGRGQKLAFVLYLILILSGVGLIYKDKPIAGAAAIVGPFIAHIGSTIYYKHSSKEPSENQKKKKK